MAKSPAIILRERDDSAYAVTSSNTILAVVGYATMGPIGVPTLVTSRNEFEATFGPASAVSPWSSLAVYRAFQQGNQILFYRVAETSGSNAAIAAEVAVLNDRQASSGYQEFSSTTSISYGSYQVNDVYDFRLSVNGGTARDVYIASPSSGDWLLSDIATKINTQITSDTQGFQEYDAQTAPVVPALASEYRLKASVDGTDLMSSGGSESDDFSVFVDPGDTLSEIATKIGSAFAAGTRGYQAWNNGGAITLANTTTLATATTYDFNVNVDGVGVQDVQITTGGVSPTWTEVASLMETAINNVFPSNNVTVRAYTGGYIAVQSQTEGASSSVALADDNQAANGTPLFDTLNSGGSFDTAVAGGAGTAVGYTVAANANTNRVRVTSDSTGTSSVVALTAPDFGNDLATLIGPVLEANDGEASVAATAAVVDGNVRISTNATGSGSTIAITAGTGTDNNNLLTVFPVSAAVEGLDAIAAETTDNVLFRAKQKGSATNNISVVKSSRTNPVTNATVHKIEVFYNNASVESFDNLSLGVNDTAFFVTKINADPDNGGSEWIEVEYEDNDVNSTIVLPDGTYTLGTGSDVFTTGDALGDYDYRVGTDGIPQSGGATLFVNALDSTGDLGNQERFDYHILITPDNNSEETQNAAIALAESANRKDFVYIADPPFGLDYKEVVEWHNGTGNHGRSNAINSSYAATYWSWVKEYNAISGEYVWSPPSVFLAAKYMEIDRRFGPWYAVAGDTRGKLQGASDIETSPSLPQRDYIYGDLNAVNPIVNFVSKGIEVYGQKTLLRDTTALNKLNVRRMVIYAKKLIRRAMEGIVFEPHNPDSWARATNLINSILEPIRQANGLDDYQVVIDSNTNTQDVIAQGIMKGIIKLVPVGTIEIVDLTISILSPGATIQ